MPASAPPAASHGPDALFPGASASLLPNPGSAFDPQSGKFFRFVRGGQDGEEASIIVTRFWPDPRCWVKEMRRGEDGRIETRGWQGNSSGASVQHVDEAGPHSAAEAGRMHARHYWNLHRALARIPDEVRGAVAQFQPQYHWAVLNLLARAPGFLDRAEADPLLVLATAKSCYFRSRPVQRPYRAARRLQSRRGVDILRWLQWPASRSVLRTLRRLDPSEAKLPDLFRLRALLQRGEPWVRHLPRLSRRALLLLDYHRDVVSFGLVSEAASPSRLSRVRHVVPTLRRVREWQDELPAAERVRSFSSLDHLYRVSRRLAERCARGYVLWSEDAAKLPEMMVPSAPFDGTGADAPGPLKMRALESGKAIYEHAQKMGNCLAQSRPHIRPIVAGEAAAYEVEWAGAPGLPIAKGTAFLRRGRRGQWSLVEIALARNAQPPDWLTQKVWNWVSERSPAPGRALGRLPGLPERTLIDPDQLWIPF